MGVLEILIKDNISDSKDLSSVQRIFFPLSWCSSSSLIPREVVLGSFPCSRLLSAYPINVCGLSLGVSSLLLLEVSQGCKDLASGNGSTGKAPVILHRKSSDTKLCVSAVTAGCE